MPANKKLLVFGGTTATISPVLRVVVPDAWLCHVTRLPTSKFPSNIEKTSMLGSLQSTLSLYHLFVNLSAMTDKSIYESSHPTRRAQDGVMCFGRIMTVAPSRRMCTVKTFFATDQRLNDLHIENCQWLNMDASSVGDEATSVPRTGSIGLVIFIQGEPFVFGYFRGLDKTGKALTGKEPASLTEGDKVIGTRAGNRITVRASGLIEIQAKNTLRSLYIPNKSQWLNFCRNFELKTDGGSWEWKSDDALNTLSRQIFRKDMANSMVVLEERGNADGGVIYRTAVGPGAAAGALLFYEQTIDITGKVITKVGPSAATVTTEIDPAGTATITAASDISVKSLAGKVSVETTAGDILAKATAGKISLEATAGDIIVKSAAGAVNVIATAGDINVKAVAGNVAMEGSLGRMKLGGGQVGLGGPVAEVVDLISQLADLISETNNAAAQITVDGNLGYSTTPPLNFQAFIDLQVKAIKLKALAKAIKGGT